MYFKLLEYFKFLNKMHIDVELKQQEDKSKYFILLFSFKKLISFIFKIKILLARIENRPKKYYLNLIIIG